MILSLLVSVAATASGDLKTNCFEKALRRDCVRLGTQLWQTPDSRGEALAAFKKGCDLGEESACTLAQMKAPSAATPTTSVPQTAPPRLQLTKSGASTFLIKRANALELTSDLDATLARARLEPNVVKRSNGKIEGYRFDHIDAGSVYETLGFKKGDLVIEVNDEMLDGPSTASKWLASMVVQDTFVVRYQRGKQMLTRTFKLVD